MNFSINFNHSTNIYKALKCYERLILLDVDIYQGLLCSCFEHFKIETISDIYLFFDLYNKIKYGYICYPEKPDRDNLKFVLYEENHLPEGFIPVPDVMPELRARYDYLKSFDSFRFLMQSLYIFKAIREERASKKTDKPEEVREKLIEYIKQVPQQYLIVACCMLVGSRQATRRAIIEINNEIFYYLAKSILNAEYLFIENYSSELKRCVEELWKEGRKVIGAEEQRDVYPYTVRSFVKLAWYAEEICKHISRSLKDPATRLVSVNTDREARFNTLPQPDVFFGEKKTQRYELFLESILDMTLIDHCYQTTSRNLEKLFILLERDDLFIPIPDNPALDSDARFDLVRIIARKKAATLLSQILAQDERNKPGYNLKYYFNVSSNIPWEKYVKDIKKEGIPYEVMEANQWLGIKNHHRNRAFPADRVIGKESTQYGKDINLYNRAVREGVKNYCELSSLIYKQDGGIQAAEIILKGFESLERRYKIDSEHGLRCEEVIEDQLITSRRLCKERVSDLKEKIKAVTDEKHKTELAEHLDRERNNLERFELASCQSNELKREFRHKMEDQYFLQKFTPSAFIRILQTIVKDIETRLNVDRDQVKGEEVDDIEKEIEHLKVFLDHLRMYIKVYGDSAPFQYRPLFESSFYELSGNTVSFLDVQEDKIRNYDSDNFEKSFFFASLGCTPVNVEYLDFVHMYRNNERRKLSIRLEKLKKEKRDKEYEKKGNEVFAKAQMVIKAESEAALERTKNEIEVNSTRLRHDTIQHLGIFATFLAFVTISIGMVKVAQTIQEYIVFCLSFTAALAFFVILIHRKHREFVIRGLNRKNELRFATWGWRCVKDYTPLILLIFLIIYLCWMEPGIFDSLKKLIDTDGCHR